MSEINVGAISEALNNKVDLPSPTIPQDAVDYVIEMQRPTADNNYTWYRKYKSGWVEQGCIGPVSVTVASGGSINTFALPIQMASNKYAVSAILNGTYGGTVIRIGSETSTTSLKLAFASTAGVTSSAVQWSVAGMAA